MNLRWKNYWKDRYKKKGVKRAIQSMEKMEKYKYLAFPNYPKIPNPPPT